MPEKYDVIALLSGGLDSLLAARVIRSQGKKVLGLNFVTPFFGKAHLLEKWNRVYGLDAISVDVGREFVSMLVKRPKYGFGKLLNPCVDCKILLLRKAGELMREYGARLVITGEVVGQRPMSQRRDVLNTIRRESGLNDLLLRPLSARLLEETEAERSGFIDRSGLLALSGRNRKGQLALAAGFGITDIPTPAGGCLLTEKEKARSYWAVLRLVPGPVPEDFVLAKTGRQYWLFEAPGQRASSRWLCIGRGQEENGRLEKLAQSRDLLFSLADFTGPTALGRVFAGRPWANAELLSAASLVASFSAKAARSFEEDGLPVKVLVREEGREDILSVRPERKGGEPAWSEYSWESAKEEIRAEAGAASSGLKC
jgi:hypothetical protein